MKNKGGPGRRRTQRHTKATNGTRSRRQTRAQRHPPGKAPPGADSRKPSTQQPDCRSQPGLTDGWSYCAPFLAACFFLALCKDTPAGFIKNARPTRANDMWDHTTRKHRRRPGVAQVSHRSRNKKKQVKTLNPQVERWSGTVIYIYI